MRELVAALVCLPMVSGVLVALPWRGSRAKSACLIGVAVTGLTALCALALMFSSAEGTVFAVEWLPGAAPLGLGVSRSGLYAVLAVTTVGLVVLLGANSGSRGSHPLGVVVALVAVSAANIAFLTDHFLARYVALEIVALCVSLAPLVELGGGAGTRMAWTTYLLLRVGDAGLLVGMLMLGSRSETFSIGPALGFAQASLEGDGANAHLAYWNWVMGGFALAAWVKLGGWPFHLWSRYGSRLALTSHAWLHATILPTLGMYLLFRVSPIVSLAGPLSLTLLWTGASGAVLAALLAVTKMSSQSEWAFVGATMAGLALTMAAAGIQAGVWVALLAAPFLRILLMLADDAARNVPSTAWRRACACAFALGGTGLVGFSLLTTWWARQALVPLAVLMTSQVAVALIAVWVVGRFVRLVRSLPNVCEVADVTWTRLVMLGMLSSATLSGGLAFRSLSRYLTGAAGLSELAVPSFVELLSHGATAPVLLTVFVLGLGTWRLRRQPRQPLSLTADPMEEVQDREEWLVRAAQAMHAVLEVGIVDRVVELATRAVLDGSRVALEAVEHGGLEGLLNRVVEIVRTVSRAMQRWHTGRLRRNLLWIPVALSLAVLGMVVLGR